MLQRLAAVQLVTLTPKRGAHVTSPSVEESQAIFRTRALLEVANLPDVIARCQPPHLAALENIIQREQQAHAAHDGPAAIRHSADFHIQLQAISGNPVLTEMVTRLSQRSSLVIAAWGFPGDRAAVATITSSWSVCCGIKPCSRSAGADAPF